MKMLHLEIYQKGLSAERSVTPTITLSITRDNNSDTIGISDEIKERIVKHGKGTIYPEDVFISITGDTAIEVDKALNDVVGNALSGLLIVIIVLFLFIGFRESLIVAFVIPLSLLSSLTLLEYNGMSLNTMSLVALILALGMLVDNAIVIMENIDRIRDEGLDVVSASKIATNQVAPAVFAATLTTMSAFLPMAITSGIIGLFIKAIPVTVIFAIAASFVISLVITPALCSRFLSKYKVKNNSNKSRLPLLKKIISVALVFVLSLIAFMENGKFGLLSWIFAITFSIAMFYKQFKNTNSSNEELKIIKRYANWMDKILRSKSKKIALIVISIVIFFSSLLTIPLGLLKIELFPTTDSTSFTIDVETPSGYLLEDTGNVVREIETVLFNYPEVEAFVSKVGSTGTRFTTAGDNPKFADISVDLVPENERTKSSMEIIDSLRNDLKNIAGAKITLEQEVKGPESEYPINIKVIGEDLDKISLIAKDFAGILKEIPGTAEVSTTIGDNPPEIQIVIDKEKTNLLGLDARNISAEIRNSIHGVEVSTFIEDEDETDIVIQTSNEEITSINDFEKIYFTSSRGEQIAFSQVASLVETKGLNEIEHEDLKKIIKVQSNLAKNGNSTQIIDEFQSRISDYPLPNDVEISYGGENEDIKESFTDMFKNMLIAILLVFIILAIQFNSLSQPMVVLFSVPLATIGALLGLIITKNNFGLYSFTGIVALVGIAVNDAIVLVDYTNYLRRNGSSLIEAIIEAGKTRFMPVLATSITTIGGILPLALKDPNYSQMGYALIFGLVASTLLTLVYIPMLYSIIEGFKDKIRKRVPMFSDRR
ncbi:efflux RND transporter permease subunit [Abyssisolibacter fermentans]|uniref:efflux RND transporter permease subunit n=1 Tax=Abyssisolibacter fermentans TaxID=1766203 RepID=UPI0012E364C5|nr:efflux RND transporter permease subunit [Abyssisolibacter fermentans]